MTWSSSQPMDTTEEQNVNGASSNGEFRPAQQRLSQQGAMDEDEQRERRASIREIMQDSNLTEIERRRSIQSLMDGRRRSSGGASSVPGEMSMMAAAAAAAAEFYDSSDDDSLMDDSEHVIHNRGNDEEDPPIVSGNNNINNNNMMHSSRSNSSLSSAGGGGAGGGTAERRIAFQRRGRSASLRGFAAGAAAAAAAAAAAVGDPEDAMATSQRMEKSRPKCSHYERQCTLISPCCGLAFGCRICHDECPVLPPPILLNHQEKAEPDDWKTHMLGSDERPQLKKRRSLPTNFSEEETHHDIDRFAVKEVICRNCFTRQSSKTNNCIGCKIQFGEYHCDICNLWMSADEDPYHCGDCGFCRVGGSKNFRHCHDCGMCIDALLFHDHNCKAGKYMSNCPVCQEDLFSSRSASHEMPCGHAIHWHCFRELTSYDTRCPVCKKTAETHEQMAPTWSAMAMGIALQPVPPEMARVVTIVCNDCEENDCNRRWHFLGVQCNKCGSFNTTVQTTTLMGREAAAFLGDDVGQPSAIEIPPPAGNTSRTAALNNVMAAMEESASSLASFDPGSDNRRNSLHAQLVNAVGLGSGGTVEDMEEEVPHAHETSSGSSLATNF